MPTKSATERLAEQMGGRIAERIRARTIDRGPELPPPGGEEGNGRLFIIASPEGLRLCEVDGGSWFEIGFAARAEKRRGTKG